MSNIQEKNLRIILSRYPDLYKELNVLDNSGFYETITCQDGNKTIKVIRDGKAQLLHSKYNPIKEAYKFAEEKLSDQKQSNVIYGFGMGYHIIEMQRLLYGNSKLFVYDLNIEAFKIAVTEIDLTAILEDKRIEICVSGDLKAVLNGMKEVLSNCSDLNVILHVPSVQSIPEELEDFKFVLEDWNIRKSADDKYVGLLYENYISNRAKIRKNVLEFAGKFKDMPVIIVSSGPSLDKNVELLKQAKGKALIISAGSALKGLLKRGIIPDFFIIIDPVEMIYDQVKGVSNNEIPGIFLATACKEAVANYNGPKFIAVQDKAYAVEGEEGLIVDTGGSVATTAIDIALKMGGNPIIMIGQDLAFSGNKKHSEGYYEAHSYNPKDVKPVGNMRTVKGQDGEILHTTLGLLSYKRWIENRIEDKKGVTFINATEGGAFINGAIHIKLQEAIVRYMGKEYEINAVVKNVIDKE